VRRIPLALVVAVAALGLAACGGGHKGSSSPDTGLSAAAQVKSAYLKFFSAKTPVAQRVALLQNGQRFKGLVTSFAKNPLAKTVKATVISVRLQGPNRALVKYAIGVGGTALPPQNGTAVRENGTWKVGDTSLCKLVALQGPAPPACTS
jgi:hypothetical protein